MPRSIKRKPNPNATPEEIEKRLKNKTKRKEVMSKTKAWISEINPCIDVLSYTLSSSGVLLSLHIIIWIEPHLQVRMTGVTAATNPYAVAYNGWKRYVAESLKNTLRQVIPNMQRMPGMIESTFKFYVNNPHRWRAGDLSNYVKATEDMINDCSQVRSPEDIKRYKGMTNPYPIWIDDCKIKRNGIGQGSYWVDNNPHVEIYLQNIEVEGPKKNNAIV